MAERATYSMLVCGSRGYSDRGQFLASFAGAVRDAPDKMVVEILSGGADGPDTWAIGYGRSWGHSVRVFPADWKGLGKRAGIVRNLQMLDEVPALVLAFWDGQSKGTKHTIDEARRRGIKVEVVAPREASDDRAA